MLHDKIKNVPPKFRNFLPHYYYRFNHTSKHLCVGKTILDFRWDKDQSG